MTDKSFSALKGGEGFRMRWVPMPRESFEHSPPHPGPLHPNGVEREVGKKEGYV